MSIFLFHVQTSVDIEASPETIWSLLTEFSVYDNWNPMLRDVTAKLIIDDKFGFSVIQTETKKLKLKAKMVDIQANQYLAWRGGHPWVLGGEHYFRIESIAGGKTRFHHGEKFSGLLLPLLIPLLKNADTLYMAMNDSLKQLAEDRPTT